MALAALIDDTEGLNHWSDRDVVRQAEAQKANLSRQDITNYRHRGMRTIVPDKIAALAAGLRLPTYRVAVAVLADHGIELPLDMATPESAIGHDHTLPAATRDALLAILKDARRR